MDSSPSCTHAGHAGPDSPQQEPLLHPVALVAILQGHWMGKALLGPQCDKYQLLHVTWVGQGDSQGFWVEKRPKESQITPEWGIYQTGTWPLSGLTRQARHRSSRVTASRPGLEGEAGWPQFPKASLREDPANLLKGLSGTSHLQYSLASILPLPPHTRRRETALPNVYSPGGKPCHL